MWQRWNQSTHIFEKSTDNGGSWTPLGLNASIITEGTLPDARLSSNVALHDAGSHQWAGQHNIANNGPRIWFSDALQPANAKVFTAINLGGLFKIIASDDAFNTQVEALTLTRSGDIRAGSKFFEANRSTALGYWQDIPFNAANFYGTAPLTWTVGAAALARNRYTTIGKTCIWTIYVSWFSGSNVTGGSPGNTLNMALPVPSSGPQIEVIDYCAGIAGVPIISGCYASFQGGNITINKNDNSNFAVGAIPGFIFTILYEMG